MIWFDIKKLENKISINELTEKDGFNYVLAYFILSSIVISFITNNSNGWINLTECIITVLINVWGLNAVFSMNNEIDGKDFFKRFFSISWVIGVRLLVFTLILVVIAGLVIGIIFFRRDINYNDPSTVKDFIGLVFTALYTLVYYLLVISSFRRLKATIQQ